VTNNHPQSASIEFECSHCHTPLRISRAVDFRGGVKCPRCATINQVKMANQSNTRVAAASVHSSAPSSTAGEHASAADTAGNPNRTADELVVIDDPEIELLQQPIDSVAPANHFSPQPGTPAGSSSPRSETTPGPVAIRQKSDLIGAETETRRLYTRIIDEVARIYVGQEELVLGTLVALFSGGHVLIESVPGLGKTLFVRTLGKILGCDFGRIQFTADLMPSDITGAPVFNMKTQEFDFRPGPVFTQLLLADEINRAPAKTHAALLEIMQEKHVTVDGKTHDLPPPFLVMATQNPIESEGTYNLPEAQLDRFMFKLVADYPSELEEAQILLLHGDQSDFDGKLASLDTITNPAEIVRVTQQNAHVNVDSVLVEYINKIVRLTRSWQNFHMGASPRAGISFMQAARTLAAFYGRDYAVPDDIVQIALPILRHRVVLTAEAEVEGQSVDRQLNDLIRTVEVPRLKNAH
jgi:MoxR-like ATPase